MKKSTFLRSAALLGAVVILASAALAAGGVDAARGGAGGGKPPKGGGTTGSGVCAAAPNPAAVGSTITISGSGFRPNVGLGINVTGAGGTQMGFVVTSSTGTFSTPWSASWLGTETVSIQDGSVAAARCTFQTI